MNFDSSNLTLTELITTTLDRPLKEGDVKENVNFKKSSLLQTTTPLDQAPTSLLDALLKGKTLDNGALPSNDENLVKCLICGDTGSGINYGAMSCDGCKSFFKRTVNQYNKSEYFCCNGSANCEVNMLSRNFCQYCRLKKCFDIGMKWSPRLWPSSGKPYITTMEQCLAHLAGRGAGSHGQEDSEAE